MINAGWRNADFVEKRHWDLEFNMTRLNDGIRTPGEQVCLYWASGTVGKLSL